MAGTHRARVEALLAEAAEQHANLISLLPADLAESIPVDAQGVTQAIDHLATAAGLSESERRALIRPHAVNPAVLHARVFGGAPLTRETVIADSVGAEGLGQAVRRLLVAHPPPLSADGQDVVESLRATYAAQEQAALMIAAALDAER